jgi:uncharacterized repeat protein (TIGR01451 family)
MTRTAVQIQFKRFLGLLAIAALLALSALPVLADSTGEHAPGAAAAGGTFTNAANALVCDGVVAQATGNNKTQDYVNYGFAGLPGTATVTGIQVRLRANDGSSHNRRFAVTLSWNNGTTFTAPLRTRNFRKNASLRDFILGGSSVLWGHTWTLSDLADGAFRVRVTAAKGSAADPANLDCIPVTVFYLVPGTPDLNIGKSDSPDPVEPGENLTYTISYSNTGQATATNVIITDATPANTTFVSASPAPTSAPAPGGTGTVTWNVGSLPISGSGSVTLVVSVNPGVPNGTLLTNDTYSIASDQNTASPGPPVSTVVQNPIILSMTKSDSPDPVQPGTNLTYTLTVSNAGTVTSTNAIVSEQYDGNVTFLSAIPSPDSSTTDTWTFTSIPPGGQEIITVTVLVAGGLADGTLITNNADVSDDAANAAEAVEITTVENVAALSIGKTDSPDPVAQGASLTYTITYQNTGSLTLTGVKVAEAYDPNVTFVSAVPSPDASTTDMWTIGTLTPGQSGTITITGTVASGLGDGSLLHNQAHISDDSGHSAATSADTTVLASCGDGLVGGAENCDDGAANGTPASCCTAICQFVGSGSACSSGTCDGAGHCVATTTTTNTTTTSTTTTTTETTTTETTTTITETTTTATTATTTTTTTESTSTTSTTTTTAATSTTSTTLVGCDAGPVTGCQPAMSKKAKLSFSKARMSWKWVGSGSVATADFGNPPSTTDYLLCVYDDSGAKLTAQVPAAGTCGTRPCWKTVSIIGFKYADKAGSAAGITKLSLRSGDVGHGKIASKGSGANLAYPTLPFTGPVRVQLRQDASDTCWEATYTTSLVNSSSVFKAKSD